MKLQHTNIEFYPHPNMPGKTIYVKREDTCSDHFGKYFPPFSKVRGIMAHLIDLKEQGIKTVGYTETSISMAGWGVAAVCKAIGLHAVIFNPIYKKSPELLKMHRKKWLDFDAELINIPAGMAKVNFYICRKKLKELYPENSILLPLGLPFKETIDATSEEVMNTLLTQIIPDTIIVNVGSGTIAAGVWRGVHDTLMKVYKLKGWKAPKIKIIGIMGRTGNVPKKMKLIESKAGLQNDGLFRSPVEFELIDPGWEYTQECKTYCPFPCHPFYDRKAWDWLINHKAWLFNNRSKVLFWNIGREI